MDDTRTKTKIDSFMESMNKIEENRLNTIQKFCEQTKIPAQVSFAPQMVLEQRLVRSLTILFKTKPYRFDEEGEEITPVPELEGEIDYEEPVEDEPDEEKAAGIYEV